MAKKNKDKQKQHDAEVQVSPAVAGRRPERARPEDERRSTSGR